MIDLCSRMGGGRAWVGRPFRLLISAGVALVLLTGCGAVQRKTLFFPTHHSENKGLAHWRTNGKVIGFSREVSEPANIWLFLHGNGGQAADRIYALPKFSEKDSVFILEYPGFGLREGKPSKASIDRAAVEAYRDLRIKFPGKPVCVVGESLGSGPACELAMEPNPPDKIVLVVPFDNLKSVAAGHAPYFPVGLVLGRTWNNVKSLASYKGPVEIFAAKEDRIIPPKHARKLADSVPQAGFHLIEGGHNEWWRQDVVEIRNP
jgi:uncharacterized protein